jgi:hypothetical protein
LCMLFITKEIQTDYFQRRASTDQDRGFPVAGGAKSVSVDYHG